MLGLPNPFELNVLLRRYLDCQDEDEASRLLERLVTRHAAPILRKVLAQKGLTALEFDAAYTLAVERVLRRLRQARDHENPKPIRNFAASVRLIAHQAFGDFLEEKHPPRRRFKHNLRYLFEHHPLLKMWTDAGKNAVCGLREWEAAKSESGAGRGPRWQHLREDPCGEAGRFWTQGSTAQAALPPLVYALLTWVGHPVALEELVTVAGVLQNVFEPARSQADTEEDAALLENLPDDSVNIAEEAERKAELRGVWEEVCRLRLTQRKALLMGGERTEGGMLRLLVSLGVACHHEIGAALEYPWETFALIWKELPWEDKRLAAEMGISPENVRFHRCEARRRLRERCSH